MAKLHIRGVDNQGNERTICGAKSAIATWFEELPVNYGRPIRERHDCQRCAELAHLTEPQP